MDFVFKSWHMCVCFLKTNRSNCFFLSNICQSLVQTSILVQKLEIELNFSCFISSKNFLPFSHYLFIHSDNGIAKQQQKNIYKNYYSHKFCNFFCVLLCNKSCALALKLYFLPYFNANREMHSIFFSVGVIEWKKNIQEL